MATQMIRVRNAILILAVYTIVASSYINAEAHSRRVSTSANLQYECKDCAMKKQKQEEAHSQEKMISIRTEIIKNQILQKLRLDKPPDVRNTTPSMLRQFLHTNHPSLEEVTTVVNERKSKEFYGKILSVAVLPEAIQVPSNKSTYPSALMYFQLTPKIVSGNIVTAELWFYNNKNSSFEMVVSEINNKPRAHYPKKLIALNIVVKPLSWHKVEIESTVKHWKARDDVLHEIEISCRYCDRVKGPIDVGDNKPLLIIRTSSNSSRTPRSTCNDSNSNGCCLEELYINFTDIGWSNWIVQPSGYFANYCKGSCINDIDRYRYHYSTVMRELITKKGAMAANLNLGLCCTPSKMSSVSFIYADSNDYVLTKEVPNMVVEECDCA